MADKEILIRKTLPDAAVLHEMFLYDGEKLWWKERPLSHFGDARAAKIFNTSHAGKEAGRVDKCGRRVVKFFSKYQYVHRVVWAMHNSEVPNIIDHIDGNTLNNSLGNLRPATHSQNMANSKTRVRMASQTGVPRGVFKMKNGRYKALLCHQGKTKHLGCFDTAEEAAIARNQAAVDAHAAFARVL